MSISAHEEVVIQAYGPEHAGELAGWVYVRPDEREDSPGLVHAAIAYGRIDPEGASYGYSLWQGKDKLHKSGDIRGFTGNVELATAAFTDKRQIYVNIRKVPRWMEIRRLRSSDEEFGDALSQHENPMSGLGTWAIGSQAILGTLKEQLAAHGAPMLYPPTYYSLAVMAETDQLLADPDMQDTTQMELQIAKMRAQTLWQLIESDKDILQAVENYSSQNHERLVEGFVQQRRNMAELEQELSLGVRVSALHEARVYAPVGQGTGHREWPFMNADEKDENAAYGLELRALRGHNYGRPIHEYGRELRELRERYRSTDDIAMRLGHLAVQEAALATS